MAVLLITHDLNLVRRFADRVAVMENGHIVEQGTVADVFARPQHAYTRKLIDSKPVRDVVEAGVAATHSPPVMQASHLRVAYPVAVPGLRGWFKSGEFVAVQGRQFQHSARPDAGRRGRVGFRQVHPGAGRLGLLPVFRAIAGGRAVLEPAGRWRQGHCARWCRWCFRTRFPRCRRA